MLRVWWALDFREDVEMVSRIEIGLKAGVPDARGRSVMERAKQALGISMEGCRTRDVYKVAA